MNHWIRVTRQIIFNISYSRLFWVYHQKACKTLTDNLPISLYVNRIENRISIKIKTSYYLEFLTSKTMNYLKVKKKKNSDKTD